MRVMKIIVIGIVIFSYAVNLKGEEISPSEMVYTAYITGNMELWKEAVTMLEASYKQSKDRDVLYDLTLSRYGLIAYSLSLGNNRLARTNIDAAENEVEILKNYPNYRSSAYAIHGALYAFRISLAPLRAVYLGQRSLNMINQAIEEDPLNPAGWIEQGNSRFYAPAAFGGSKTGAIESYQKAILLFEANLTQRNKWLYLNTLVSLAQSYQETGNSAEAILVYEKALKIEPQFSWVRDELLPEIKLLPLIK